jgi:hypothetical protein
VPESNGSCHPTVFTDRFWDDRDGWLNLGVGTVSGSLKVSPLPGPGPSGGGPIYGTPDQYINGLDYALWVTGGYPTGAPCLPWQVVSTPCVCLRPTTAVLFGPLMPSTPCICLRPTTGIVITIGLNSAPCVCLRPVTVVVQPTLQSSKPCLCLKPVTVVQFFPRVLSKPCLCLKPVTVVVQPTLQSSKPCLCLKPVTVVTTRSVTFACSACPGGAALTWQLVASGFSGTCTGLNGTWALAHTSGCQWTVTSGGNSWTLNLMAGPPVQGILTAGSSGGATAAYQVSGFDCVGANTLTNTGYSCSGTVPATLTLNPM